MPEELEYPKFQKIKRLNRGCVITEKIDGTNALVFVGEDGTVRAGQRTKWVPWPDGPDNHGFAQWVKAHEDELRKLGPGHHYGEWYGQGIQRTYGLTEKRFALFRWPKSDFLPECCEMVPALYKGPFQMEAVKYCIAQLIVGGSKAVPGFMKPEGVVVWHEAIGFLAKVTCENDEKPKERRDNATR